MSEIRPTRAQLIWRRWRAIIGVAALTLSVECVAAHLDVDKLETLAYPPFWVFAALAVLALAGALLVPWRRVAGTLGLRHPFAYPPRWFGIALGTAAALYVLAHVDVASVTLKANAKYNVTIASATAAMLPFAAMVASLILGFVAGPKKRAASADTWDVVPAPLDGRDLSAWYLNDEPLDAPADDLFGHRLVARRIAERFRTSEPPAQALVGPLGAGKTTVRLLVQRYVQERLQELGLRVISVELWPYETPRAAVEGILEAVVDAFSEEISTSRLNGVPEQYGQLIAKLAGLSEWLPKAVEKKAEPPFALLQRFDDVATAIGSRYVLWVEDLERFAAGSGDEPGGQHELERLAPIRALLAGLDRLRSIAVVTATTDLYRRFDLEKIARYVETVPEVGFRTARKIISAVRAKWIEEGTTVVDGLYEQAQQLGWDSKNEIGDPQSTVLEEAFLGDKIVRFASAVAVLAATPRGLKQGLRRAHETWSALRGEIDIDDVLALSMLRESSPTAFALLQRNVASLRGRGYRNQGEKPPIEIFNKELNELKVDARTREATRFIVRYIFVDGARRVQSVAANNHADYWTRFLTVPTLAEHERDQVILAHLRGSNDEAVADALEDDRREKAVYDFSAFLAGERLPRLLTLLIKRRLTDDPEKWDGDHAPGLSGVWILAGKRRRAEILSPLAEAVERGIEIAAPTNLSLLHELIYWYAIADSDSTPALFDEATRQRLKAFALQLMLQHHTGQPERLAKALKGASPYVLHWLCYGLDRVRRADFGLPFPQWHDFAPTILDAFRRAPDTMAGQVAAFVVRSARTSDARFFDRENCATLFGDVSRFVELFRSKTDSQAEDPLIRAVREQQRDVVEDDDAEDDDANGAVTTDARDHAPANLHEAVIGHWYDDLAEVPATAPNNLTSAVVPERPDLDDGGDCLTLERDDRGNWFPLSIQDVHAYPFLEKFHEGGPLFFVRIDRWPTTYRADVPGSVDVLELPTRFGDRVAATARSAQAAIVVALVRQESADIAFVKSLYDLCGSGNEQAAVEHVMREIESRLHANRWVSVDEIMRSVAIDKVPDVVHLAILTTTFPAKDKLKARPRYVEKVEARLKSNMPKERAEALLATRR